MNKHIIVLILFSIFWISLVFFTGTISSGYHFTDDHEIISINESINNNGIINTIEFYLKKDLSIRFRPFYYLHRIALVKVFQTNFLLWSIYNVVLAIVTSYFLFLFMYKQGYRLIHAFIFPFLTLVGAQSVIWWRLGPNETIGFFLLSASLFFLVNSIFRKNKIQLVVSGILMFLASLSKESFTMFIPAYLLLLIWFNYVCGTDKNIITIIRNNIVIISILFLILLIEAYIIIFFVGTNKIGYAGIDNSFNIINFINYIYEFLIQNPYIYLMLIGMIFLLFQNITSYKFDLKKLIPYLFNIVILIAIIMPQFLLYNKSGIFERYLLPLNLGFSLFVIYLLKNIYENNSIAWISKQVFTIATLWVIFSFLKNEAIPNAKLFAKEGVLTNKLFTSIIEQTTPNDSILIVLNGNENFEWGHSINQYLTHVANRKNINFYKVDSPINNDAEKNLDIQFSNTFSNILVKEIHNSFSSIAILPFSTNNNIKIQLDKNSEYQRIDIDYFSVYNRKNAKQL